MNFKRHIARPAVILDVNPSAQLCTIQYADRTETQPFTCPLPHPFASSGWGILTMPTKGTRVLVDTTVGERPVIVSTIPMNQFSLDFIDSSLLTNISVDQSSYPRLKQGEIAIKSASGAKLGFYQNGAIQIDTTQLHIEYGFGASSHKSDDCYINTEAHRQISGLVRRDIREKPKTSEATHDKLVPISANNLWSVIGRNPTIDSAQLTVAFGNADRITRNPAFVEHRSLVYEFAHSHAVEDHAAEVERLSNTDPEFLFQPNKRDNFRTDVFNLGMHLPNNLIEKIEGTAVDIYGNVLDINRNIIDFTGIDIKDEHRIEHESTLLRRSIKYHMEINARKYTLSEGDPNNLDGHNSNDEATKTGYSLSRWSIDVDGEGLTKINIPASSNTGNIPLLARFINDHDLNDRNAGDFRPTPNDGEPTRRDIQHIAFGYSQGDGVQIPQEYSPVDFSDSGISFSNRTAYHEITTTASAIIGENNLTSDLDNNPTSNEANAGGRSIHANIDGSCEINIGRDTADKKSMVIDTSGSIISRIGQDKNGNSLVSQTDGDVVMQIGGEAAIGDQVASANSFKMYINSDGGNSFHTIEVNSQGIFITSAPNTNIVMESNNNLILSSKGRTFINGEVVSFYGSFSEDGSTINGERLMVRNGNAVL